MQSKQIEAFKVTRGNEGLNRIIMFNIILPTTELDVVAGHWINRSIATIAIGKRTTNERNRLV